MPRGRPVLEAWEERAIEQRESVVVTARCAWCAWSVTATVRETREAHETHRKTEHPEVRVKARTRRHRPYRQYASEANVEDNIANARAQGAATWAGTT